jgi:hypothetical protein
VVAGFAAAVVSAAGPGLALRRLRPDGPAVVLAARAAGLAAAAMGLAGAASIVAAVGLYLWAPADAGYREGWQLAVCLPSCWPQPLRSSAPRAASGPLASPPWPDGAVHVIVGRIDEVSAVFGETFENRSAGGFASSPGSGFSERHRAQAQC